MAFLASDDGHKLHLVSLAGLAHYDFNAAGAHSYEQALQTMRRLRLPAPALEELFRRACFNVVARNQDDHVKNISFLMGRDGAWRLAPAYDLTFAYHPDGPWTRRHQMLVNGKSDDFTRDDLLACGEVAGLSRRRAATVLERVTDAVQRWPTFAATAGVLPATTAAIGAAHRRL